MIKVGTKPVPGRTVSAGSAGEGWPLSGLCLITNRRLCPEPLSVRTEKILAAGAAFVMLREKDLPEEQLRPLAEELAEVAQRHHRRLIINSSLETALAVRAWGLQLPLDLFLKLRSDSRLADFNVGVSIHNLEEAMCAWKYGAHRIVAGNIFKTDCKPGRQGRGLWFIGALKQRLKLPIWAVGGLRPDNIGSLVEAGIPVVCLMSYLLQSPDPARATRGCLAAMAPGLKGSSKYLKKT